MFNEYLSLINLPQLHGTLPTLSPSIGAAILLLTAFAGFAAVEKYAPKTRVSTQLLQQSYVANFSLFTFNSLMMSLLSAAMLWLVAEQHSSHGLLSHMPDTGWKLVVALLALDLWLYLWHQACHRYDIFWRFHKVHHNDPYLNVSTGFRVHITEMLMTYLLKVAVVIAMGIDEFIVLVNEVITTLFIMFHHTNSVFKGEKWLAYIFNTPTLHRTHHSVERKEHDRNFGAVLSIWDRLFGTLLEREPAAIGINGDTPQDFIHLLKFGFVEKLPVNALPDNLDLMIAEAAYYKAEKRSFNPGYEWDDWLAAKQEVLQTVRGYKSPRENLSFTRQGKAIKALNFLFCSLGIRKPRCQHYA
ncbi:MAG: sterol desaturase family protein [Methylococcaceae bacterium]|jgi:sterol desaturase/sphingolipid hydroxylase (fatty acid hydroxylase superfamily)